MTDKKKIITNLQKALDSLDITSDLRLVLIQTIEYLQEEPIEVKEVDEQKERMSECPYKEPISEGLEEAAFDYAEACKYDRGEKLLCVEHFKAGAKWQKEHLWKLADGGDLPEYEREVVVFTQNFPDDAGIMKVAIAHRPDPKGWNGKSITTGEIEHYIPKTYDKGGWNIPDVVLWLDLNIPNLEED